MNMRERIAHRFARSAFVRSTADAEALARMALEEMRTPSEGMLFAPDLSGHEASGLSKEYLAEIWTAMVDEAIKE